MTKEEVIHLAKLSRIALTDEEVDSFTTEMSAILDYVSAVQDMVGDDVSGGPAVGPVHNVFRKDEVTNEPDQYTADIMAEMPQTEGRFLVVKKILNQD
jgi:aspartyl-tRNA(Asn)/glutamyl-tRNA(Gln) amidotransferase subunit C